MEMLTVRNLTPDAILISRVERFEDPNTLQSRAGGYFFAAKNHTLVSPSAPELGGHAQSFQHEDLNITLAPFESYTLSAAKDVQSRPTLRITIEAPSGERHRIDTNPSYTQKSTQKFTPLSPNPSHSFTALFHPSTPTPHLTIQPKDSLDYREWMSTLPDTLPLSALSIPGTHNSHTYYRALPSVKCQSVDIKTQLANGIRFLDIRAQPVHATDPRKQHMYLVHGAFPIALTGPKYLAPLLATCYAFLAKHPSETILISLKREGIGASTDAHFAHLLQTHYIDPNPSRWHTSPEIPYLGAARGKLVLIRRYTSSPLGLDATPWPHNSPHSSFPPSTPLFALQDYCEILLPTSIPQKLTHATAHLARAAAAQHPIPGTSTDAAHPVPPGPLFLNFLSGANFWKRACWPGAVAGVVNRGVEEWVCGGFYLGEAVEGVRRRGEGDGSTGVVVMDCAGEGGDWGFVRLVVGMNLGVLMRVREEEGRRREG